MEGQDRGCIWRFRTLTPSPPQPTEVGGACSTAGLSTFMSSYHCCKCPRAAAALDSTKLAASYCRANAEQPTRLSALRLRRLSLKVLALHRLTTGKCKYCTNGISPRGGFATGRAGSSPPPTLVSRSQIVSAPRCRRLTGRLLLTTMMNRGLHGRYFAKVKKIMPCEIANRLRCMTVLSSGANERTPHTG